MRIALAHKCNFRSIFEALVDLEVPSHRKLLIFCFFTSDRTTCSGRKFRLPSTALELNDVVLGRNAWGLRLFDGLLDNVLETLSFILFKRACRSSTLGEYTSAAWTRREGIGFRIGGDEAPKPRFCVLDTFTDKDGASAIRGLLSLCL